ncbi:GNAT family N-acetyltransferase [Streptomyces sp. NPDC018019]|uniref:GNAT family N-acetyltransferase n=1 Tax=Streptomyces sp. NPDC018019 TaxID=3365030 RepID=UPI00379E9398
MAALVVDGLWPWMVAGKRPSDNALWGFSGLREHLGMEGPAERLKADRVELRRWHESDLDALDQAINESLDHLAAPWMPWAANHGRRHTAGFLARCHEEWEARQAFVYAVTSHATVIGSCGLHRRIGPGGLDLGYWIHPRWTGQRLATTAAAALVGQGFRLAGIDRIEIHHDAANTASAAVALHLGFTEVERIQAPEGPSAPGEVEADPPKGPP